MIKNEKLTNSERKYISMLRINFIPGSISMLLGLIILVLSFTTLRDNPNVLMSAIGFFAAGVIVFSWAIYVRFKRNVLKKKAIKEFDERINDIRIKSIYLTTLIMMIILCFSALIFLYIEPAVSFLIMCVLVFFGLIYSISYLIINKIYTEKTVSTYEEV